MQYEDITRQCEKAIDMARPHPERAVSEISQ